MKTRTLGEWVKERDLDYVERFQALAVLNMEIRKSGPNAERMLRKAVLEMDVGNYTASLTAAQDAVALEPNSAETHHQVGMSLLVVALSKAGAVPGGPGQEDGPEPVSSILKRAVASFRATLERNQEDEETSTLFTAVQATLRDHPDERGLRSALRAALT